MKKIICLSLLSAISLSANESSEPLYTNQIIQILADGTEYYLNNIERAGQDLAPTPIDGASTFQLYTTHNTSGDPSILLDEQLVNGVLPLGALEIKSDDPNIYSNGVRYTRVNRPYEVKYTISNLAPESEIAEVQSAVQEILTFDIDKNGNQTPRLPQTTSITANGERSITVNATMANDNYKIKEIYSYYQNATSDTSFSVLLGSPLDPAKPATETVITFPNAIGSILKEDDTLFGTPIETFEVFPTIKINVQAIYPGAQIMVNIRPSSEDADSNENISLYANISENEYTNTFTQTEIYETLEASNIFATDTKTLYTIDLIERSVFGDIVLDSEEYHLYIPPVTEINAGLVGSE